MAENVLETRIQLRYGTYSQWMNSSTILKQGEAAICAFPENRVIDELSNITPSNTPPAIGIKIGDGRHRFYELPWVQAIAADVYNWAKATNKPSYTASEISGLQSFIEENFHLSGDVTIAPRIYQLIEGTDENINKFYLRYKENNEESQWIVDTNHPIDLSQYQKVVEWIGIAIDNFPALGNYSNAFIDNKLSQLTLNDIARDNQFVTAVTQNNGQITVERARPAFENISGIASVNQGGTGRMTLTEDNVLVGNGTDQVKLIPIAESIASNNHLVPNYLVKNYVDNATAGLTGAMHFIGEATVVITQNSSINPLIRDYDFSQALPGDVILSDAKEFVWTGGEWRLLGDEGSYAIKGSIRNVDIAEDAGISQSKIANLDATLNNKVDKQEGKSLTSNDFTDELKEKLNNIEDSAQRNVIEHILVNGTEVRPTVIDQVQNTVNLLINEFDSASQDKLNSIATGAQVNKVEKILYDGEEIVPDENKVITINSNPHTDHINKIEQIFINGTEWIPNAQKQVKIIIDQAALNLNVVEGAQIPDGIGGLQEVEQLQKKIQLERIAVSGDVKDLQQTADTYIILDCGSSTTVI